MAMTLQNAVNSAIRKGINQHGSFIMNSTISLLSVGSPFPINVSNIAIVTHVSDYQYCMGTTFSQLFTLIHDDILIIQELIFREFVFFEGIRRVGGEDR